MAMAQEANQGHSEFGERFVAKMKEASARGVGEVMMELAGEFRVPELTRFAQAIRHTEQTSAATLADAIEIQVRDETQRMDEFVDAEQTAAKAKTQGMAAVAFVYLVGAMILFLILIIRMYIHQGSTLFGF